MPAQFTNDSLVATTNVAPVSGASIWRWLVLLPRKWAHAHKVARDTEMLRHAPRERLEDIGIARSDIDFACEHGHAPR
ncbi:MULTISPECIES: hypothetical protein [Thalassospira]|jgi:uncharacterized protein YjiS (DUF1127 family)|uniref:DUF1127 domain-containing protein n=1 Tax=Thalassospira povalilytica TaxID=732237 RepID=A0A8I1MAE3_9PROT|nr:MULTISPECIES: hypothetical protein [Thalassospira]MEE3045654.1 hypothetical protein [Pseudomonadota bacterium]RCK25953.1 hypothetical protein TH8_09520 [Thalassospira profundimaris]KZB69983.1 hypothetical protein AUQ42_00275 [Thalassospira sp. MCCC 1A02491]MAL40489.1 hypothetical protein [Thalassospira sp.]MBN8198227.1 hypothetical protein [Thalassospira povalilytica]|tara:strand:+ start:283 stop:516 length:234 start_codon:yes stop_codon:yes gene_type:complete